jgi:hypothetical protein
MRRETSRVSFLMCPFCVRALITYEATGPQWRPRPSPRGGTPAWRKRCAAPSKLARSSGGMSVHAMIAGGVRRTVVVEAGSLPERLG